MNNKNELSRSERKKIDLKNRIVDLSISMFKEKGFHSITMEEIANKSDIAKGTLYNHFSSKEEILVQHIKQTFMRKHFDRLIKFKELKTTRIRVNYIFCEVMSAVIEQSELFEVFMVYRIKNILSFNKSKEEESGFGYLGQEVLKLGREEGDIHKKIPDVFFKDFFDFTFIEIAKEFYNNKKEFELEKTVKKYVEIFIKAIS